KRAAQVQDVKWGEARGNPRIGEGSRKVRGGKRPVKDVDGTVVEIGGVQEVPAAVIADGQPLVDGGGTGEFYLGGGGTGRGDVGIPTGNVARLRGEDEKGGAAGAAGTDNEIRRPIEHDSRGGAARDRYGQRNLDHLGSVHAAAVEG